MKKNLTKVLALMMAMALVFSLGACGNDDGDTTTAAGETTTSTGDTTAADTTAAEETTTAVGETTTAVVETTTAAGKPTTPAQILAAYTEVMNKAKVEKPAHQKKEFQSLPKEDQHMDGWLIKILLPLADTFMTTEEEANIETENKGDDMEWFPVVKSTKGCLLTDTSKIKTATCDELTNGNYKIKIILKDEMNPEPYKTGQTKATSFTGNMFYPLSRADIDDTLINDNTVNKVAKNVKYDLRYFNCTADLEYNPQTKQIVTIDQYMSVYIDIQEGKVLGSKATGNAILYNTMKTWDFKY